MLLRREIALIRRTLVPGNGIGSLALVCAIKEYHPFIAMAPFVVYTDHISLKYLDSIKVSQGRLGRWAILLQGYTFTIKHRSGVSNSNADAISRLENYPPPPDPDPGDEFFDDKAFMRPVTPTLTCAVDLDYGDQDAQDTPDPMSQDTEVEPELELTDMAPQQQQCPDFADIYAYLADSTLPDNNATARRIVFQSDQYIIDNGLLYHLSHTRKRELQNVEPVLKQLAVPRQLRQQVLIAHHENLAHAGFERCYATIRRTYYWPRLYLDTLDYVKSCESCQQNKREIHPNKAELMPIKPTEVFGTWSVDIAGPITPMSNNFKYIMVANEHLSGYPVLVPIPNQEAVTIARALFDNVFTLFGAPTRLLSDRGQAFMSGVVAELCKLFNVHKIFTSVPQAVYKCVRKPNLIHFYGKACGYIVKIRRIGTNFCPQSQWRTVRQSRCPQQNYHHSWSCSGAKC